jgi:peptidoglycan hydrolase CwlO-like protein
MRRLLIAAAVVSAAPHQAMAQDVPGIEICTAEKTMERRTGCLQSNVNFLQSSLTRASLESQQKIDAANRQIDALKATVAGLQATVAQLQGQVQALGKQPNGAAKDAWKEAPKAPAAK